MLFNLVNYTKLTSRIKKVFYTYSPAQEDDGTTPYPVVPWEIFDLADLPTFGLEDVVDQLTGALLLEVQPDGSVAGQHRFILDGLSILDIDVQANKMVSAGGSSGYRLKWQIWPRDIKLRPNSYTSNWMDLADR
jgi:hypothetical protein